jgi:hypothetical protein
MRIIIEVPERGKPETMVKNSVATDFIAIDPQGKSHSAWVYKNASRHRTIGQPYPIRQSLTDTY